MSRTKKGHETRVTREEERGGKRRKVRQERWGGERGRWWRISHLNKRFLRLPCKRVCETGSKLASRFSFSFHFLQNLHFSLCSLLLSLPPLSLLLPLLLPLLLLYPTCKITHDTFVLAASWSTMSPNSAIIFPEKENDVCMYTCMQRLHSCECACGVSCGARVRVCAYQKEHCVSRDLQLLLLLHACCILSERSPFQIAAKILCAV